MPLLTTPTAARNKIKRIKEEIKIPVVALLVTNLMCSVPEIPASIKRCAPEKVMYPPTVPPTMVTMANKEIFSGIKV